MKDYDTKTLSLEVIENRITHLRAEARARARQLLKEHLQKVGAQGWDVEGVADGLVLEQAAPEDRAAVAHALYGQKKR